MRRRLLQARHLLADARSGLVEGGVLVVGGRVARVLRGRAALARCARAESLAPLDLQDTLLTPGLVNAHAHLELGMLAGRVSGDGSFPSWIARLLELRAPLGELDFERAVQAGATQLVSTGTTTVGDVSASGAAERILARHPLRAVVQREVLDAGDPARTDAALARVRRRLARRVGRLEALSPHAPYSVSPALMERLAHLASERRLGVAIHWAETEEEVRWLRGGGGPFAVVLGDPPRTSGLELIGRAGLLEARDRALPLALVHANLPEPGELERVARAGAAVVHCPGTHAFFGRERFDVGRWLAAGVPLALGTDSLASNAELDMTREMALLRSAAPELSPRRVLELATLGGAAALGLAGEVGELRPGAWADLVAWCVPHAGDPLEALTTGAARPLRVWIADREVR